MFAHFLDELVKIGSVSDEQARRALDRLDALEASKPTPGRIARYAGVGALAGPAISAGADLLTGNPVFGGKNRLRGALSKAIQGAATTGALPLLHRHLDRRAEMGTLKDFVTEREKTSFPAWVEMIMKMAGLMLPPPTAAATAIGAGKGIKVMGQLGKPGVSMKGALTAAQHTVPNKALAETALAHAHAARMGPSGYETAQNAQVSMPGTVPPPRRAAAPAPFLSSPPPTRMSVPPTAAPPPMAAPRVNPAGPTLPAPGRMPQFSHAPTLAPQSL